MDDIDEIPSAIDIPAHGQENWCPRCVRMGVQAKDCPQCLERAKPRKSGKRKIGAKSLKLAYNKQAMWRAYNRFEQYVDAFARENDLQTDLTYQDAKDAILRAKTAFHAMQDRAGQ